LLPEAIVWTDGSCSSHNHGGWAALVCQWLPNGEIKRTELTGYAHPVTNNQMEMQAAIEGLSHLIEPHHVYLVSDSAYLLNTLKNGWVKRWIKEMEDHPELPYRPNWDRWMALMPLVSYHEVEYIKVKGHKPKEEGGDPYNERVDKLAVAARKSGQSAAALDSRDAVASAMEAEDVRIGGNDGGV
jgi:ribonuclease HI